MNQIKIANAITSGKYSFEQIAEMFNVRVMDVEITWSEMNDADAWYYVQISQLGE
jgi:hypothetical protein